MAQDGRTALHGAADFGNDAAITTLLAAKADIHDKDLVRWREREDEQGGGGREGERGG